MIIKGKKNTKYEELREKDWESLDACVEYAIREASHSAFAKYYIYQLKSSYELFSKKLTEYLKEIDLKPTSSGYVSWPIMRDNAWMDLSKSFDSEEKKLFYGESTLRSWGYGTGLPTKYAVIQLGVYLELSLDEIQELLLMSTNEMLYPLNAIDAVCMYEIQKNRMDLRTGERNPLENLKRMKEKINKYCSKVTSEEPFYKILMGELEEIKKREGEKLDPLLGTNFVTLFYQKENNPQVYESLESFVANKKFISFRLAFQKMVLQFVESDSCVKNLYRTSLDLYARECEESIKEYIREEGIESFYNEQCREFYDHYKQNGALKLTNTMWALRVLWGLKAEHVLEGEELKEQEGGRGGIVSQLFSGEKRNKKDEYKHFTNLKHNLKEHMIRFALVCGMEDRLTSFLKAGLFWKENYMEKKKIPIGHIDKTDGLILYALRYRDALIKE